MVEILVSVVRVIVQLLQNAPRSSGAPVHGNTGCRMVVFSQQELELLETPHLLPHSTYQDDGCLQGWVC